MCTYLILSTHLSSGSKIFNVGDVHIAFLVMSPCLFLVLWIRRGLCYGCKSSARSNALHCESVTPPLTTPIRTSHASSQAYYM